MDGPRVGLAPFTVCQSSPPVSGGFEPMGQLFFFFVLTTRGRSFAAVLFSVVSTLVS
jgi:hypothetical protein